MFFPIHTERLNISPLGPNDLESFVSYRQDPEVARYQSWEPSFSIEQGRQLIQSQEKSVWPKEDEWLQLGLKTLDTSELIGDLALHRLVQPNTYEIGFTISRAFQGKGYAHEAASSLIRLLFEEVAAELVFATSDSRNTRSISLLTKLDFVKDPSRIWLEEFKGETVTVFTFVLTNNSPKK